MLQDACACLGPHDPHTLAIRSSQASFAARSGRTQEALAGFAQLAAARTRVLGPDHPHVIHTRLQWAQTLMAAGDLVQAQRVLARILSAGC
ncbi:tetratricopeptide repeat protein [Streptomyces sp. 8N616]|uniref:tetratricopeptide repeat protein n=1 Tax=Streptomyces sp. 8N616 TaxID=3457414 RepID=UPI003FD11658